MYQSSVLDSLELNIEKCFIISFYIYKHRAFSNYSIKGNNLIRVHEVKDLGITLDGLRFNQQISLITLKGLRNLVFITRPCMTLSCNALKALYCSIASQARSTLL